MAHEFGSGFSHLRPAAAALAQELAQREGALYMDRRVVDPLTSALVRVEGQPDSDTERQVMVGVGERVLYELLASGVIHPLAAVCPATVERTYEGPATVTPLAQGFLEVPAGEGGVNLAGRFWVNGKNIFGGVCLLDLKSRQIYPLCEAVILG